MMFWIMAAHFLLQIFQRFTQHIGHNADAGYHKQKVRHGFHLLSTEVLRNSVQPAATQWSTFYCRQTKLNHIYCCPSILFHTIIETTISKGKKFSYSFIGGKGYSPPFRGENSFLSAASSKMELLGSSNNRAKIMPPSSREVAQRSCDGRSFSRKRETAQPFRVTASP